jgi:hypothetical protein
MTFNFPIVEVPDTYLGFSWALTRVTTTRTNKKSLIFILSEKKTL